METISWVVGAGGLLGSGIRRQLLAQGEAVFDSPRIRWGTSTAIADLAAGLDSLVRFAAGRHWQIYWCAGVGVTGSGLEEFRAEVSTFESLLRSASALPGQTLDRGSLFIASSAGGVYGGSQGAPFDEFSTTTPLGHYGNAKLAIEEAARAFSHSAGVPCLIGRISNLYGPGQSLSKPQGLISHLCLSSLTRKPLSVFVSLDTLRDYIYVDDCAALIIAGCRYLRNTSDHGVHLKIIASGRSVSIGMLLSEFKQIMRRRPEIIMGSSAQSALQSPDLRLRSKYWTALDQVPTISLADGIARTLQSVRASFLQPADGSTVADAF